MGLLDGVSKGLKGAVSGVESAAEGAANEVQKTVRNEVKGLIDSSALVTKTIDSFVQNPARALEGSMPAVLAPFTGDWTNIGRHLLEDVYPEHIQDPAGDQFIQESKDFRDTLSSVRSLTTQLSGMNPSDPRYGPIQQQLSQAQGHLTGQYGYTANNAPQPGTLWMDPEFGARDFANGDVNSTKFPVGTPVTSPPSAMDALFHGGRSVVLPDAKGNPVTVHNPDEYRALIAANRTAAGMPRTDGDPTPVHVSFQGGGGKGKRYGPALETMYQQGLVPTSVTGTSAGSIAAGLVAAGADPAEVDRFVKDPVLGKLIDLDPSPDKGGVLDGKAAYDVIDQELRKLTGITDRPVTFADLKMPLQILASKMSDTDPPAGQTDLSQIKNRMFVFSQETTPNTPVALAIRASMAIPGAFDPVKMIDPTTGREVDLVDGGVFDNMPLGYNHDNLPTVGLGLLSRDDNNPASASNNAKPKPIPGGNLDSTHLLWNALNGYSLHQEAADGAKIFRDRNNPPPNTFMLTLPVWNLKNPNQQDSTIGFGYDPKVDPAIDAQTQQVTQDFLRKYLGKIGDPTASGTNLTAKLPANLSFNRPVTYNGQTYQASYSGGDSVTFAGPNGSKQSLNLGKQKIDAMYLDDQSFGDLSAQLGKSFADYMNAPSLFGFHL